MASSDLVWTKPVRVDPQLLQEQQDSLAEIQSFLTTGQVYENADEWHAALEGILNLLAALVPMELQP